MADPGSISIGKYDGIELELHWTFLFLLFIALLYGIYFGPFLFVFIVLLFVMVVIHEFAHSITAKKNNIEVKKIILLPLGGASIIDLENIDPKVSLKIAIAGPLMSVVLGFLFGMIAIYAPAVSLGPLLPITIAQLAQLLFLLNILLGVFNLVPAFPLDGGRILKSYLEEKRDPLAATKLAVNVSKGVLSLIVIGSVVYAVFVPGPDGSNWILIVLWDAIIALFIWGAAQSELQSAYITKYTENLHVYDAISRKDYVMIKPETSMRELYRILLKKGTQIVIFRQGNDYKTVTRLVTNPLNNESRQMLERNVSDYSVSVPTIDYGAPLSKAIDKMRYEDIGIIVVVRKGKIAGILQAQHVESIIALHLPHSMGGSAAERKE